MTPLIAIRDSHPVSLWEMLRFHAKTFVEIFNHLIKLEYMLGLRRGTNNTVEIPDSLLLYYGSQVKNLREQLQELGLSVSAKKADDLYLGLTTQFPGVSSSTRYQMVEKDSEELRRRVEDELEGKALFYVSDHVDLLSDAPLFGEQVDDAFPSARHDILEAGRCLALRRSTACVLHLMRALEPGLASLAAALGVDHANTNWQTIIDRIENEITSRNKGTHGEKWKNEDEPFFAEAATHFRMIKNAWRNHAMHAKDKYTDEEAEKIYESVNSFMRHLSERLSEEGQFS